MPPLKGGGHLIGYLFGRGECGIRASTQMGAGPLTHEAIRAWMENTDRCLPPWECKFLIALSQDFLKESQKATKRDAKAPWAAPDAKPLKTSLQLSIRNFQEATRD